MANIKISLSQAVINQYESDRQSAVDSSLSNLVDSILEVDYLAATNYFNFSSYSLVGNTLRTNFADGSTATYIGAFSNPNATSGTAAISNQSLNVPNALTISESGNINYQWQAVNGLSFYSTDGVINSYLVTTRFPANSSFIDQDLGNVALGLGGAITFDQANNLGGRITEISTRADKFLKDAFITGNFAISGNAISIAQGLSSSSVSGSLTSYTENYYDGSTVSVNSRDKGIFLADKQEISINLFSDPNNFPGNDVFDVRLPSRLFETWIIASGMGSDNITLQGGGGLLNVNAGGDNDRITLLDLNHFVDGGSGIDLVSLQGARSSFQYDPISTTSFNLSDGSASSTLVNIERLQFSDISLALDIGPTQNAGSVYMLYKAAFNRPSDAGGMGYWIAQKDGGADIVTSIAQGFVNSPEFIAKYGANPTNASYVNNLYQNVLGRAGEAGGVAYWTGEMDAGRTSKAEALVQFATLPEGAGLVAPLIANGIQYQEWLG